MLAALSFDDWHRYCRHFTAIALVVEQTQERRVRTGGLPIS